ncbi:MAG: multidrug efflux SMR transporter [Pseudomonadota bacterium]|nr:multidrug efflux SMR transporter [Pseudomonadota bacterium]
MGYKSLILAIFAEVIATIALKSSNGFSELMPGFISILFYVVSFYFLMFAMQTLPVAVCYAIWSATGIALIAIISSFKFGEVPDIYAIVGLTLIVLGVFNLTILSKLGKGI